MQTIYLDPIVWDFVLTSEGNIAAATEPYRLAQDAASAIRLFKGECYYDIAQGIPYWEQILGKRPPVTLMKQRFTAAALTVPGVVSAKVFISSIANRVVSGQVQVFDANGVASTAGF